MLGAIAGDIIGSPYEGAALKDYSFELFISRSEFTDDSVLTAAIADAILEGKSYKAALLEWGKRYPDAGYGPAFAEWLMSENPQPYDSWGNGSAMRVSPVGWYFNAMKKVLREAEKSAECTHSHPEGIKGAQSIAAAVFLARTGKSKKNIKEFVEEKFGYDLSRPYSEIKETYSFDASCQGTVPEALISFLESDDYEDALRKAVALGGDADTLGAITGSVAEAFYGDLPAAIKIETLSRLPEDIRKVAGKFYKSLDR